MKKVLLFGFSIMFILSSCVSQKQYSELEAKQKETQDLLNSATVKLNSCLSDAAAANALSNALKDQLADYVKQIDNSTFKLLKRALPGPYTFILPSAKSLPNPFKKKKTVGIRIPKNNIALDIVKKLGRPIISTSIRDDDEIIEYTTDPELIKEKWNNLVELVINGGFGDNDPSTIIDMSSNEPLVIREGKGTLEIL